MVIEESLLLIGLMFYAITIYSVINKKIENYSHWILFAGVFFHFSSAIIRWIEIGHPPIFGTYEASLQGSWFIALYVLISYKSIYKHFKAMALTAIPMVILLIVYGASFNRKRIPLTISELSLWVDFHALFSWLAYAPFTLAFCLSGIYLYNSRKEPTNRIKINHKNNGLWPKPEIIDELCSRYINLGFVNHTIMIILGSYYSSILHGKWWQWDPVESTALITWLSTALYIHMRLFYKWKEKKAAVLYIVIFITVIFSYWGLIYMPQGSTYHIFDLEYKGGHG